MIYIYIYLNCLLIDKHCFLALLQYSGILCIFSIFLGKKKKSHRSRPLSVTWCHFISLFGVDYDGHHNRYFESRFCSGRYVPVLVNILNHVSITTLTLSYIEVSLLSQLHFCTNLAKINKNKKWRNIGGDEVPIHFKLLTAVDTNNEGGYWLSIIDTFNGFGRSHYRMCSSSKIKIVHLDNPLFFFTELLSNWCHLSLMSLSFSFFSLLIFSYGVPCNLNFAA